MAECIRCGEPATGQFSIDIDVAPWRFCEGCRIPVQAALHAALAGDKQIADSLLEKPKRAGTHPRRGGE